MSRQRTARRPSVLTVALAALGLVVSGTIGSSAAQAAPDVVYDAIGPDLPSNVTSLGFEATQTNEFGDLVELAPGSRELTTVSVVMSSHACETGGGTTCVTTPGTTFTHPLTMTLYNVAGTPAAPTVGPVITTLTTTFTIPFRPSADAVNCPGVPTRWFDGSNCFSGLAVVVDFVFPAGTILPDTLIWGIAFNTEHYGYAPRNAPGPYNSLNVGAFTIDPTIGTDVDPDMAFVSENAGGFVSQLGFAPFRPMARIETLVPPTVPEAPSNVTATPGDGQVALTWTAPPDGGSPITGYVIGGGGTCTPTPATATSCVVTGLANGVAVNFTVAAVNGVGTGPAATSPTVTPIAQPQPVPPGPDVVSLTPARLLDSRGPNSTVDGLGAGGGPMGAGSVTEVQVAGRGGVPADAVAAVLNVTAVAPQADGFATVFPCGQSVPTASNLNYRAGVDIANAVIVQLDAGGKACIYTFAVTHLLADVNGYIPAGSAFSTLTPARLLDSRGPNSTVDGLGAGGGPMGAGSVTEVQVAGRGGVPADAVAAVLNVTAVAPQADGFATVFPCGQSVPTASNLNYRAGVDIANAVIVQLDAGGKACIYTFAVTHLLADVNGYIPAGAAFSTLTPARLLDSRGPNSTVDGLGAGGGPMGAGSVTEVQVAGRGGVPADAVAAVLNVTVVAPEADGFATVFPCGQSVPTASNLNYRLGVDIANAVIVQLDAGGKACIYTFAATHLLADVNGYIPA